MSDDSQARMRWGRSFSEQQEYAALRGYLSFRRDATTSSCQPPSPYYKPHLLGIPPRLLDQVRIRASERARRFARVTSSMTCAMGVVLLSGASMGPGAPSNIGMKVSSFPSHEGPIGEAVCIQGIMSWQNGRGLDFFSDMSGLGDTR